MLEASAEEGAEKGAEEGAEKGAEERAEERAEAISAPAAPEEAQILIESPDEFECGLWFMVHKGSGFRIFCFFGFHRRSICKCVGGRGCRCCGRGFHGVAYRGFHRSMVGRRSRPVAQRGRVREKYSQASSALTNHLTWPNLRLAANKLVLLYPIIF